MRVTRRIWVIAGFLLACCFAHVGAADTVKIAFIDPLSGTFANIGQVEVRVGINTQSTE